MDATLLPKSWNIDQILEDLDLHGFAMLDDAYSPEYQQQVLAECSQNLDQFREAAIQNGVVSKIRSDHILWIHENLSIAQQHTQTLLTLAEQFNQAFYLGFVRSKRILPATKQVLFMPCTAITHNKKMIG